MTRPVGYQDQSGAQAFACVHCGHAIEAAAPGTGHRNHCPSCLWSMHVDLRPGDRRSSCRGDMEPIAVSTRPDGEWAIVHRCRRCGILKVNRIAGDDSELLLMSIALRPLARPPFPLERLDERTRERMGASSSAPALP